MSGTAQDRLACINLPALALQILLIAHPEWRGEAVAVVAEDRPQGRILQLNKAAHQRGVRVGMSYTTGLSLATDLRARVVEQGRIDRALETLLSRLRHFSPRVEPSDREPGVFWIDASGLGLLYKNLRVWAEDVVADLREEGYVVGLSLGFSRFGTYAVARGCRGVQVHRDPEAEREAAGAVSLERLEMETKTLQALERLGVHTLRELLALPPDGLRRRFGAEVLQIWRLGAGQWRPRLRPQVEEHPIEALVHLDEGEQNVTRLLFLIKRQLSPLQRQLARDHQVVAALKLVFHLENGKLQRSRLQPAEPTLSTEILQDLIRLRLEAAPPTAPVEAVYVQLEAARPSHNQARLLFARPRRDPEAAAQALARLRAELGEDAVLRARLHPAHLPEAGHRWERLDRLPEASPDQVERRPLVRRLMRHLHPLPPQSRRTHDEGEPIQGLKQGVVVRSWGPYLVSGGWWAREVHREYQFVETQRGELLWIFYDRPRHRWFLQGVVS